jgi:C4-dicarboxylate transporter, DctM subunit
MLLLMSTLFLFLLMRVPIAISLGASSMIYVLCLTDYPVTIFGQNFLFYLHKSSLLAIPFFVTAGFAMGRTRLIERLFDFCYELLKWMPGGVGVATMFTAMIFAAFTGSSVAEATTLGVIAYPSMKKRGYPDGLAGAILAIGGTLGILIPPSWPMILYGVIVDVSIGKLFMAGIIPGIILGSLLTLVVILYARKVRIPSEPIEWPLVWKTFLPALPGLFMPIIVLGGLYGGIFTATEAGAVSCAYALIYGIVMDRRKFFQTLPTIVHDSIKITTMVFFLLGGVGLFGSLLANEYIPQKVTMAITSMDFSPFIFLFIYMLVLLVMGCFVDASGMIGLTVPIVFPACMAMGIDPIALCILIIVNCELGAITPPMGITLYGVSSVTQVPIETILRGVIPFFIVAFLFLFFLLLVPSVSTWLPATMYKDVFGGV